jgi:hypothetical protein
MRVSGWPSFTSWSLVGVIYALACLAMMSIGIFILLVAILATMAAARNLKVWPEIFGLAAGPATVCACVGFRAWSLSACGAGEQPGVVVSASGSVSLPSGTLMQTERIAECTSVNAPLLTCIALALVAAALIAYAVISRRTRSTRAVLA